MPRRRHLPSRLLAALWSLWFVVALAEPSSLHGCPMDASMGTTTTAAMPMDMPMPGEDAGHHPAPTDAQHHHSLCECLGACTNSAVAALGHDDLVVVASVTEPKAPRIAERRAAPPRSAPKHVRPPANGPPSITV
jgi:hypothetical protein